MENLVIRDIFEKIALHLDEEEITVIIGPRQVGKTTILLQLKEHLVLVKKISDHNIKVFNLDIESDRGVLRDQTTFIEYLKAEAGDKKLYIFVDEVQRLPNPGIFFKGVYDLKLPVKLVLTGSSTLEIRSNIHEALTGRKRVFFLETFSFKEYLRVINAQYISRLSAEKISSIIHREELIRLYKQYLVYGGYPKIVLSKTTENKNLILTELYQSYIDKDISGFLKIADSSLFSRCLTALALQIGNLVNTQELSATLGIARQTVERYLSILEQTFVIFRIPPYFTNPRTELKKMSKYYFFDTGLRNFIAKNLEIWDMRTDQGILLENGVANILKRAITLPSNLHFWRSKTKAEVDFVIPNLPPIPIEVKLNAKSKSFASRSFLSFMDHYKPPKGYIASLSEETSAKKGNFIINSVLPWNIDSVLKIEHE